MLEMDLQAMKERMIVKIDNMQLTRGMKEDQEQ